MLRSKRRVCVVSILLLIPSSVFAQQAGRSSLSARQIRAVDEAMQQQMQKQQVVGLALGIIRQGRIAYLKGYGFENREQRVPVTSKTLFRWASVSKTLTAIAAMQLVEKGRLDLQADVRTYVPEFTDHGVLIKPQQLLCHQGGIVHYKNGRVIRTKQDYDAAHPFANVILALDTFKESPLIARPGEKYSYTTHGYILLSAVVERAGKERFADQIKKRIAAPLRLTTLQPDYQWNDIPHRAVGYRLRRGAIVQSTDTDVSWKLGGGGFISNIDDMAKYAAGLINGRLVSKKTENIMWTSQTTDNGEKTKLGLGFFVETQNGTLKVSHNGSQEKVKTRLVTYPRRGHGMVVMSNSENADPGAFSTAAYRALSAEKSR